MKIHEYQARQLLADARIPVPAGRMVETVEDAVAETEQLLAAGETLVVVKAQVHAGGRGKAGFVKLVRSVDEAREAATFMLGNRMVSVQTGPEGIEVNRLLVAAGVDIEKEYYVAVTLDRSRGVNT
ncbi:MAG: succinate--CoA ligase subunit beta, partial [Phycisphaeraceae bacterium]|nr:succinate--CoA ligase subunit beta [Phycisphaeraceae bacterium]